MPSHIPPAITQSSAEARHPPTTWPSPPPACLPASLPACLSSSSSRSATQPLTVPPASVPPACAPPHPVVQRPGGAQLLPQLPRHHPAQPREVRGAEEAGCLPVVPLHKAVVIPGRDAPEGGVGGQQGRGGFKVQQEVCRAGAGQGQGRGRAGAGQGQGSGRGSVRRAGAGRVTRGVQVF